jgi:hypothetical protein
MVKNYKVVACDRAKNVLGETVIDLPTTVAEAIELGFATSERDLMQQFSAGVVIKIQGDMRNRARTPDEVVSTKRSSLAKAFMATLHGE